MNQVSGKNKDLQILQTKEQLYKSNVQQMNMHNEDKYISNFIVEDEEFKRNTKEKNSIKISSLEVDTFENNAENSNAYFQSRTPFLHEKTKLDDLQMEFKVCFFFFLVIYYLTFTTKNSIFTHIKKLLFYLFTFLEYF